MAVLALATVLLAAQAQTQTQTQTQTPPAPADGKPRIERAADLPRFTYRLSGPLESLVRDREKFAPFGAELRRNIDSVLAGYDIPDKATQRDLITQLAILDFLDGRHDLALLRAEQRRTLDRAAYGLYALSGVFLGCAFLSKYFSVVPRPLPRAASRWAAMPGRRPPGTSSAANWAPCPMP